MSTQSPDSPTNPNNKKANNTMKAQYVHKEVAELGPSTTSVNPGGSHTPKVNAKPRNRKPLNRMSPKEALMQMSLECDILKLGHLASSCELRLIKRRIKALLKEVGND